MCLLVSTFEVRVSDRLLLAITFYSIELQPKAEKIHDKRSLLLADLLRDKTIKLALNKLGLFYLDLGFKIT